MIGRSRADAVERQPENALAELVLQQSEERDKQQSQTEVNVPDGGTVMLGGIKRQSAHEINQSLPYLNRLFKNDSIGRETNTLMMTVTPRIIIPEEEEKLGQFANELPVRPDEKTVGTTCKSKKESIRKSNDTARLSIPILSKRSTGRWR
jgi:type II secretory pathway component GspD/PulD (secretin)